MRRLGGSDISKLLGLSRYGNAANVYERVMGLDEDVWNPRMERGAMVEPQLRAHAQRLLGVELEDWPFESDYVESPEHDFAHAQIDDLARWQGQPVVMEYKSQSSFAKGWAQPDIIPASIEPQVAWQLMCTGRELALVVVGFGTDTEDGGFDLHNICHFEIQREPTLEALCVQVAREFWLAHAIPGRAPDLKPLGKKRKVEVHE